MSEDNLKGVSVVEVKKPQPTPGNPVREVTKPIWELSNDLNATKELIKNKIATCAKIEEMVVAQAEKGLNANMTIFTRNGPREVADHATRHKYWHDILLMKRWLSKTDVNIDMRSLTISAQEEDILRKYERGE